MSDQYFEEEEFTTQFNGKTVLRVLAQTKPHWPWVAGFLVAILIASFLDGYFTYLGKEIVDRGILAGDRSALTEIAMQYGMLIFVQALSVFVFIYLTGILGEKSVMTCARNCSIIYKISLFHITAARLSVGLCHASHQIPSESPIWLRGGCWM